MNGKFYIFVATPMKEKDREEVEERYVAVKTLVYSMISLVNKNVDTRKINVIRTYDKVIPKKYQEFEFENRQRVYYLGSSISMMYQADLVVFDMGWTTASGCQVEYCVCEKYGIPGIDLYGYDKDDNESIYTLANWFNQLYIEATREDAP